MNFLLCLGRFLPHLFKSRANFESDLLDPVFFCWDQRLPVQVKFIINLSFLSQIP